MNILMVGELYKFGGASEIMEILAGRLEAYGHHVILLYGFNPGGVKNIEKNHHVLFQNKYLRRANNKLRFWVEKYNLSNLYAYWYMEFLIKKEKIQTVHLHAVQGGFLSIKDIEKICRKHDVVWTIHGTWPFTGGCMYYWNCFSWRDASCAVCKEENLQMKYRDTFQNRKRKEQVLLEKNICFAAPSKWMLDNMKQSFLKNERMTVIENGIDLQIFRPLSNRKGLKKKYGLSNTKRILMFNSGSVKNPYKGWQYLKTALDYLENAEEYELLIVGKETEDIDGLNIPAIKAGYIHDKAILNELYNVADIFILPSVQDNFPTVTLEAQAAGTPVLAFSIGGIGEQITSKTGWLVKEISAIALKKEIQQIFYDKDWMIKVKQKGKMARQRCEIFYDERSMAKKYEKLYTENKTSDKGQ